MWYKFFFGILLCLQLANVAVSQIRFNRQYDYGDSEWCQNVIVNHKGEYVSSGWGRTNSIPNEILTFYDLNGNILDSNRLIIPDIKVVTLSLDVLHENMTDTTYMLGAVAQWHDSTAWLGFRSQACLVKYNQQGDTVWMSRWGNSTQNFRIATLSPTKDGGYLLAGTNNDSLLQQYGAYICKVDKDGHLLWEKTISDSIHFQMATNLFEGANGRIYCGGGKAYSGIADTVEPHVYELDSLGNLLNTHKWIGNKYSLVNGIFNRKLQSPTRLDQYLIQTGIDSIMPGTNYVQSKITYLKATDTNFNTIWTRPILTTTYASAWCLLPLKNGRILLTGTKETDKPGDLVGWAVLLDDVGNTIWDRTYFKGSVLVNYITDAAETSDGGFIMSGVAGGAFNQDAWLLKVDSNGCEDLASPNCWPTNTKELIKKGAAFTLYPNPTDGQLNILSNTKAFEENTALQLIDITGKLIYSCRLGPNLFLNTIRLPQEISSGHYVVKLLHDGKLLHVAKLVLH